MFNIKRRVFITLLGGAMVAYPAAARSQPGGKIYRIGFVAGDPTIPTQPAGRAFLDGLRESGFIEGKNIVIDRRFTEGRQDRYAEFASELVRLKVDVIVTSANEATLAVKRANANIPVVMMNVADPLGSGIVASLAHTRKVHHRFGPGRFCRNCGQAIAATQGRCSVHRSSGGPD